MKRKQLKCELCDLDFEIYSTYYQHIKLKHREPSVNCFHCDAKFITVAARNQHYYVFASRKMVPIREKIKEQEEKVPISQKSSLANYFADLT